MAEESAQDILDYMHRKPEEEPKRQGYLSRIKSLLGSGEAEAATDSGFNRISDLGNSLRLKADARQMRRDYMTNVGHGIDPKSSLGQVVEAKELGITPNVATKNMEIRRRVAEANPGKQIFWKD